MSQNFTDNRLTIKHITLSGFENTYKENYTRLFGLANKMVNDKDAVGDIVQEVFIAYFTKIKSGYEIRNTKSWLSRVTLNKCIDHINKQKKIQGLDTIKDDYNEDEAFDKKETKEIIRMALSKLKAREKAIAILYSEGCSYKEIAEATGINFNSIGKTLSRTLTKLENELKKMNYELH